MLAVPPSVHHPAAVPNDKERALIYLQAAQLLSLEELPLAAFISEAAERKGVIRMTRTAVSGKVGAGMAREEVALFFRDAYTIFRCWHMHQPPQLCYLHA